MLLSIHPENPQPDRIQQAVDVLEHDGVIVYPTDTIYGIGCSIYSKKGIDRIRLMKGRDATKFFSILCADLKDLSRYARNVSNPAYKLMRRMLPGPYTVVLEASREIPRLMHGKRKTVGIRVSDNRICHEMVSLLGHPIITTSANRSGEKPGIDPELIHDDIGGQVDLVIDGGVLHSIPSTVVDLTEQPFRILRAGNDPVGLIEELGEA